MDKTTVEYWTEQLEAESSAHDKFREKAREVEKRYHDERDENSDGNRFNILWSNTEVLEGAVLSERPKPDVSRRFKDPDEASRQIAEVMERALSYSVDVYDFDGSASLSVLDYLLVGMGQMRAVYTPYFERGEQPKIPLVEKVNEGETEYYDGDDRVESPEFDENGPFTLGEAPEEVVYEEVTCDVVPWSRFRWQPADTWNNVMWCAIDHFLTKDEAKEQFKNHADQLSYAYSETGEKIEKDNDKKARAKICEIFDKKERKVIVISEGYTEVIDEQDDPLKLEGFYPFPKPMIFGNMAKKFVPSPEFLKYQDQAEELDQLTGRLDALVSEVKWNGYYDGSFAEIGNLQNQGDGEFDPISSWADRFGDKVPALENAFAFRPIDKLIMVIRQLYEQREAVKQTIYEITGLSDIVRGATKASETLGAQQLKQQNAGVRLQKKQNEVSRFFRDLYRIKAEIIVEQFSPDTLSMMTGIQVTPEMMSIMKDDLMRTYKIDIETDSTVQSDQAEEQRNAVELLTAVTSFTQQSLPLVQAGVPIEIIKEFLLFAVRRFKGGRQLEQVIEKIPDGNTQTVPGAQGMGAAPPQLPVQ